MTDIIVNGMAFSLPLFIIAVGGIYSERSGVTNLALEGFLGAGAFFGAVFVTLTSGLFAAFLKLKAFLVDLARKHVAHGPETEPHKQHAHGDEDEGDDGWEKGRADGRGQGFDDPLIDVAVKIDEKEHEEEADARFDPDVSP